MRVVPLTESDLCWDFGRDEPYVLTGDRTRTYVDPFPAYAHSAALVETALAAVEAVVDVDSKPTIYSLPRETEHRTNGWATRSWIYDKEAEEWNGKKWVGSIVLSGKRIPPHPAMTRYLVAHEYGHHVEWEIERRRGIKGSEEHNRIRNEYAALRGCDPDLHYGGGTWHASAGELLANDFRILIAEVEPEFWPHPGFARPEDLPEVRRWWDEALA